MLGAAAVIAIAVVFIVQFRPATGQQVAGSGPVCAVEVKGSCISSTHFWAAYRLLAPRNAEAARLKAMGLRRQTMEGLVDRWALVEDAKRLGVTVSDADLNGELTRGRAHVSLPADKIRQLGYALGLSEEGVRLFNVKDRKTKKFDEKAYIREVRFIAKMHPEDFREYQRQELIAGRMRDLIRARVRVGDPEAFEQFSREKSTRTLDYARFDRRFYGDLVLDRSQKTMDAWAEGHKDELDKVWESRKSKFMPECRLLRHVLARTSPVADDPEAAKAEARKRVEAALERINKGEDFGDVAKDVSDDTSASRGGDLGCVTKGQMVKPFEDAAFALEPGKVSAIVETEYGFHVIKLEQIAKDADAEKVGKKQVKLELYLAQESERLAAEAAKQVLDTVRGGKTFEEALKAHLAELSAKLGDKKDDGDKKKGDKGDKGDKKDDDKPKKREPVTLENHPNRPVVETTAPFNVSGDPISGVKAGNDVPTLAFKLDKPGDIAGEILPLETGYAVMQLKEKTPATKEQWDKDREYYMSAMRAAKQNDALIGYVKRLRSSLGSEIKFNQALMTEPKEKGEDEPPAPPGDELPGEE